MIQTLIVSMASSAQSAAQPASGSHQLQGNVYEQGTVKALSHVVAFKALQRNYLHSCRSVHTLSSWASTESASV